MKFTGWLILPFLFFPLNARAIETLEQILTETNIAESTTLSADGLVAFLYKLNGQFKGLQIHADENSVRSNFK